MRKHRAVTIGLALLVSLPLLAREPASVLGFTYYTVNSTTDPGDGNCDVTQCTLREAITAANSDGGNSIIVFNIPIGTGYNPSTGVWTIQLASALPKLAENGTGIHGSTQTDNQGDTNPHGPEIAVNGASSYDCFILWSANNTVEGLAINECMYGIQIISALAHHNNIRGNYIGLDAQGSTASGNTQDGVYIGYASDNTVGGDTPDDRNIISGNGWDAVDIYGAPADRNVISGNYIGTDSSGRLDVGNGGSGVGIAGGAQDNQVGPDNIIAFNDAHGVSISGSETIHNTVTQNSIHSNLWQGITLSDGGNGGILPPVITTASCNSASGTAPAGYGIRLFSDREDEGRQYHWWDVADGSGAWSVTLPSGLFTYPNLTATATDTAGNTSEFSPEVPNGCQYLWMPLGLKGY
jgi:CSLREA domain-containing protein